MPKNVIPIFYACDDHFVKYMIVSLHSMMQHASKDYQYRVHVLHTNISPAMQEQMHALANDTFQIYFEDVSDYLNAVSAQLPLRHYYTKTTYYRLFLAEMFPQYDKAIYIDSDTIVQGDISKLYETDLGDRLVGACHEQAMEQVDVYGTYAERVVGISRHQFFNAGLLLIPTDKWREKRIFGRFLSLLGEYNFVVTQDEDYLNLLCKDHVFWLDQKWNTAVLADFSYPYPVEEAYILHYIMVNKPWHYENCRCADIFWQYAAQTAVYRMLKEELAAYTEQERERDRLSAEHLCRMAIDETNKADNYQNLLDRTKRNADRVAVVKRIEEYERQGKFDIDVEEDPPSRELLPDEIDYLRTTSLAKLQTKIAYQKAKKFLDKILKEELLIVKEIKGLENLSALESGAVITCNHFNAFDSFAMHVAYLRSGQKQRKLYRVIREGNYTSFPGFYGYLMRHFYTLPLSSNVKTMQKFNAATVQLLREGNFVLMYPEQSMWWNYRKPKPLKPGAFSLAVKSDVPVLPCFITMRDSDRLGEDGYYIQEYTIHIGKPLYPDNGLSHGKRVQQLMDQNYDIWKTIYEQEYQMPLEYLCNA